MKKIDDTKKKTQQIMDLKRANDEKFHKQMIETTINQNNLHMTQKETYGKRQKMT